MRFNLVQLINKHEESFHQVFDLIPIPLFAKDIQGRYLTCNKAYEDISGLSRKKLLGKTVYDLWPKQQADFFFDKDQELFDNPNQQIYESDISASFGRTCIVQFHKVTFTNGNGDIIGLLGAIFDLTEKIKLENKLKKANIKLELLSKTDKLTNIANRRSFDVSLVQQWKLMQRAKIPISLILCDIDYFKLYNDAYGHQAGDDCLALVAQAISVSAIRPSDLVARYGGEEFVVILPDTDNEGAVNYDRFSTGSYNPATGDYFIFVPTTDKRYTKVVRISYKNSACYMQSDLDAKYDDGYEKGKQYCKSGYQLKAGQIPLFWLHGNTTIKQKLRAC